MGHVVPWAPFTKSYYIIVHLEFRYLYRKTLHSAHFGKVRVSLQNVFVAGLALICLDEAKTHLSNMVICGIISRSYTRSKTIQRLTVSMVGQACEIKL